MNAKNEVTPRTGSTPGRVLYCKRRDCFNLAFADGYCGAHLREHKEKKAGSFSSAQRAELVRLRDGNAALLAALKACVQWIEDGPPADCQCDASVNYECQRCGRIAAARAAIAQAEQVAK
jgi:hypothetical protein